MSSGHKIRFTVLVRRVVAKVLFVGSGDLVMIGHGWQWVVTVK